jgi:hypothetical protein
MRPSASSWPIRRPRSSRSWATAATCSACPSSAYWVGETYGVPQLTVILNNGGWNAPKVSTLLVHPEGVAKQNDRYWITTTARSRLADVAAAASGCAAFRIERADELDAVLRRRWTPCAAAAARWSK